MKKKTLNKTVGSLHEMLKANRKASREAEFKLMGPGFHSKSATHKNKKAYTRKLKHKGQTEG